MLPFSLAAPVMWVKMIRPSDVQVGWLARSSPGTELGDPGQPAAVGPDSEQGGDRRPTRAHRGWCRPHP